MLLAWCPRFVWGDKMSKAGLWPKEQPRPTESNAEIKVYDVLSRQLPLSWAAWNLLSVRKDKDSECEGDFVVAIRDRGFLVLEVNGGLIKQRDGCWYQNSKLMGRAPRDQTQSFAKKQSSYLPSNIGMSTPDSILTFFQPNARARVDSACLVDKDF